MKGVTMGQLGVSIYPAKSTFEKDSAYLDLAKKYGFKRVFTSLLEIEGNKEEVLAGFKKVVDYANSLDMEVMVDIAPRCFKQLDISYDDLSFFAEMGADGIRLDVGYTGAEEAKMTRNPYGLKIEINMSSGTNYLDSIMAFHPNLDKLYGSHNFYPQRYAGLAYDHFIMCSEKFRKYGINSLAFVNSQAATFGPWPVTDGLCTLEEHRDLPIATQVKHLKYTGLIDDIIIANCYPSEEEMAAVAEVFFEPVPSLLVEVYDTITDQERINIFEFDHSYRGDRSEYMIRSTWTRVVYKDKDFPPHNTRDVRRGDVLVLNENFGQYKGETQIVLKEMPNHGNINVVGRIAEEEMFLLPFIKPWSNFKFTEKKGVVLKSE